MEKKRIRLVWGTPAVPGGRWSLALVNLRVIPQAKGARGSAPSPGQLADCGRHLLHISLRGVGLWLLAAALVVYLLGAAFVLMRLRAAHPSLRAGYLHVALPSRWDELDRLRGAAIIDQARELIARKQFAEGFALLRQGLARNPADFSARLDIAGIYAANALKPQAVKLLHDGLAFGYPGRAYLEAFVALLNESDQPDLKRESLVLVRERLGAAPAEERLSEDLPWLDEQVARALSETGRDAEAFAHLEKTRPARDPAVRRFMTERLLAAGRADEAADIARRWAEDFPKAPEPLCVLADALRAAGDIAGMDDALARLERLDPARPDALLFSVVQNHRAGRAEIAERKLDQLIFRHGSTPSFYATVCASFLGFRYHAGLARAEKELRERGLSPRPALWARVKLAEQARDWRGLLALLETLQESAGPRFGPAELVYLEIMTKLAQACLDGASGTQASLVEIARNNTGSVALYRTLSESLLQAGRAETARQILELARGPYPESKSLGAMRSEIETALAAAPAPISHAEAAASPRPELPLAGWLVFAEAVEARAKAGDKEGALALFTALRRTQPAWTHQAARRIDALELSLRARAGDPLMLQVLVRSALAREHQAPDSLLALARQLHSEGFMENAVVIAREILRQAPDHEGAAAQLELWAPRSEPDENPSPAP